MTEPLRVKLLESLKESLGADTVEKWLECADFAFSDDKTIVGTPNKFARNWVEEHYRPTIETRIREITGKPTVVEFIVVEPEQMSLPGIQNENKPKKNGKPAKKMPGLSDEKLALNQKYTFENFVVGPSNRFAHAASLAVAERPAKAYNPLFIYGDVGLGKTHLLNAIGHKLSETHRVRYASSEAFMNELIYSMRFDKMNEFRKKYRDEIDVLLVDDVQFFAGKGRTQEEFFHTFNSLFDSSKQIVISSNQYPKEIVDLDERLVSRLVWGLIVDIQHPDLETKLAILSKKALEYEVLLSAELAMYLATNLGSNVRELEGSLTRVFAFASLNKLEPTPELAREVLKNLLGKGQALTIETIQKVVAGFFNIKVTDLKSQRKLKMVAYPRQICMYLARKLTSMSFPEIAAKFSKDHSTVIHAVQKIGKKIEEDPSLKTTIDTLEKNLSV